MASKDSLAGAATLPVVLLISGIVMELAVVGVVLAAILGNTIFGSRVEAEALSAARAGANDAIIRVNRYKNCPGVGCPASYSMNVGSRSTADVTIASSGAVVTIDSVGTSSSRKKKLEAILGVDSLTGQVKLQSFKEVTF